MKRKIIKLAEKTLVVSLPAAWTTAHNLEKGDELAIAVDGEQLTITPLSTTPSHTSVELDLTGITERVLRWKISSFHKQGYDEIILLNYTPEQYTVIEELTKDLFIGFLVKEKTKLRIVVGQVAAVDATEFDTTLRRGFRHLEQMAQELYDAFATNDSSLLAAQIDHERTNNKITNFCERLLNKNLIQKEQGHFWYVLAWNLEKIADSIKYVALHYQNDPAVSSEALHWYKEVLAYLQGYAKLLYSFNFSALVDLSARKKELEATAITLLTTGDDRDRVFIHYMHQLVLQLADFSASIIALKA